MGTDRAHATVLPALPLDAADPLDERIHTADGRSRGERAAKLL